MGIGGDAYFKKETYLYSLDPSSIAQKPAPRRTDSRLMLINRKKAKTTHDYFYNILNHLTPDDILVFNNAKVLKARLLGIKEGTGARIELLLVEHIRGNSWRVLCKPFKRISEHTRIRIHKKVYILIKEKHDDGEATVEFFYSEKSAPVSRKDLLSLIERIGEMPLPPYIKSTLADVNRYQTVYAKVPNSSAAPTAGLHFTKELLCDIKKAGIQCLSVELAVGPGTFRPVKENNITQHSMHAESYAMNRRTADILNTYKNKKRIVAVGTTAVRVLESNYRKFGMFKAEKDRTELFIYPPQKVSSVDALITNFHLPGSTLLMLV
ncbi:tRNA preQ1(34) S-adenosylmethionine ribosyltransferase-isomerase QueA, partial [Spirochaetota bacterium]